MLENTSRRTVAKGAAWAIPALQVASTAPALAASGGGTFTGTKDTPQTWVSRYYRVPSTCTSTNLNSGGFLDTQGCNVSGSPVSGTAKSGDCLLNTNTSTGTWIETSNTTSGTAQICNVTMTYKFNSPIAIDNCPNGTYNTTGAWTWTQCTTLNGWTYSLSADRMTLTLTYNKCATLQTSTGVNGTGTYLPGYFLNYRFTNICPTTSTTIQWSVNYTYYDRDFPTGKVYSKSTVASPVTNP